MSGTNHRGDGDSTELGGLSGSIGLYTWQHHLQKVLERGIKEPFSVTGPKGISQIETFLNLMSSSHRCPGGLFHNACQGVMFFTKDFLCVFVVPVLRLLVRQTLTNHHLDIFEGNSLENSTMD